MSMHSNEQDGAGAAADDLMMEIVIKTDSSAAATLTRGSDGQVKSEKLRESSRESGTSSKNTDKQMKVAPNSEVEEIGVAG